MVNREELNYLKYNESYQCGVNEIGGKAYSIARLSVYNIDVPKGIVLPKQIWNYYEKTENKEFLRDIIKDISKYINAKKYAVRSSAIGEDSSDFSWAGCFESILDVETSQLERAIIECGKSLKGERVQTYRRLHNNINKIEYMGILIQEYIEAEWSGVCFSSNPVTGNEEECIIEYQKGKSGSVVGGYGEPTTVIIGKKNKIVNEETDMPINFINKIFEKVKEINSIWKVPVDVEWVIKNEKLYITQTRPITTI